MGSDGAGSVRIRPATLEDVPAITDIYNEAVRDTTATFDLEPRTVEDRRQWLVARSDRHSVLVREDDAVIHGWGALSPWSPRRAYDVTAESSVYIRETSRAQGHGAALLDALLDAARESGIHSLIARITEGNPVSIHLHESRGFTMVGTLREVGFKFDELLDVHVLQWMASSRNDHG